MGNSDIYLDISFEHDSFDLVLFFSFCFCVCLFFFFFGGGGGGGGLKTVHLLNAIGCWLLLLVSHGSFS